MFALEWQLFKKPKRDASGSVMKDASGATIYEGSPWIGHLLNSLLYGLTGIVMYLLLLQILVPRFGKDFACFVALVTSFLFIAHPIHTEAVANIKGRDEIMTLLGSLAALYYSWRAHTEKKPSFNIFAALIFFMALLSKENAITFLAVVPMTYFFFSKADIGTIVKQTCTLICGSCCFPVYPWSDPGVGLWANQAWN